MDEDFDLGVVSVVDEDGVEHQFEVLDAIETDQGRFVALTSYYESEEDVPEGDDELIILQVQEENGEEMLLPVEDETLFDELAEIFEGRLAEMFDFEETEADQ